MKNDIFGCFFPLGWLEPLVQPIKEKWNRVVTPTIDDINEDTFYIKKVNRNVVGTFTWDLTYRWVDPPKKFQRGDAYM